MIGIFVPLVDDWRWLLIRWSLSVDKEVNEFIPSWDKISGSKYLFSGYGLTPSEMFLQRLITSTIRTKTKQQCITHVGNRKYNLSV
jgi:hypothetical protein